MEHNEDGRVEPLAEAGPAAATVAMPTDELESELTTLAAHLAAATHRWLVLLAEFDRREGWAGVGVRSCAHWLSWQCGIDLGAAREKVRVARSLGKLPLISDAFSKGELSFSVVRALTRVATPASEAELVELARHGTVSQVERVVRALRRATEAELLDDTRRQLEHRGVTSYTDEDGSLVLRARLPADAGAAVTAALTAALEHASRDASESHAARLADALTLVAEAYLDGHTSPGHDRHQVVVTTEAGALGRDEGGCHLADGTAVSAETARRVSCDATIVPVTADGDGQVLDVGRRSRRVPARLRHALERRDQHCRFPGCTNRSWVDAHHVTHWAHGGRTDLDNLVLLCRPHHRVVHEGGFTVALVGRSPEFRHPAGWVVPERPAPKTGAPDGVRARGVTADTIRTRWDGQPLDLDLALHGLLHPGSAGGGESAA